MREIIIYSDKPIHENNLILTALHHDSVTITPEPIAGFIIAKGDDSDIESIIKIALGLNLSCEDNGKMSIL
ncbi:MAG: hypothetical protein Q8O87_02460 [bacterium]|nr:hypothetical protein [bacterium]